jgi:hypothetical protein
MNEDRRSSGVTNRRQSLRDRRRRASGVMWAKFMDPGGEIEIQDLSDGGLQEGIFQAQLLISECQDELAKRCKDEA